MARGRTRLLEAASLPRSPQITWMAQRPTGPAMPAAKQPGKLIILAACGTLLIMTGKPDSKTRRSERQKIRLALVLLTDSNDVENRNEAYTVDISQHGCRIEGCASLTLGQVVHLIPSESSGAAMSGRVVWVGEPASELAGEAGIELLQPLSTPV